MGKADNLWDDFPTELVDEHFSELLSRPGIRIERIVSRGHRSPEGFWYDQPENEWVLLLKGAARLRFAGDDKEVALTPGSHVEIPAHCRHRVEWTDPDTETVWLAVHYP